MARAFEILQHEYTRSETNTTDGKPRDGNIMTKNMLKLIRYDFLNMKIYLLTCSFLLLSFNF